MNETYFVGDSYINVTCLEKMPCMTSFPQKINIEIRFIIKEVNKEPDGTSCFYSKNEAIDKFIKDLENLKNE